MKIRKLDHVSFAFDDIGPVAARLAGLLDLPAGPEIAHGRSRKVLLDAGSAKIELLETDDADSLTGRRLSRHGPGFFHLCFEVEDIAVTIAELRARGVALLTEAPITAHDGAKVIFTDPDTTGGIMLEFKQFMRAGA